MTYCIIRLGQRARGGDEITNPVYLPTCPSCPVLVELENKANECMIGSSSAFWKKVQKSELNPVYLSP